MKKLQNTDQPKNIEEKSLERVSSLIMIELVAKSNERCREIYR